MSSETAPLQEAAKDKSFILRNIKIFTRSLGLITIAVLWISVVVVISDHDESYVGFYLIAPAAIVSFFELTWILDKGVCCVREGCCCRIWSGILWVDTWVKFLLYCILAIPCFLDDDRIFLGIISGLLLIILGILYLVKTFRGQVTVTVYKTVTKTKRPEDIIRHEMTTQTDEALFEVVITKPDPPKETKDETPKEKGEDNTESSPAQSESDAPPGSPEPEVNEDGGASTSKKRTKKK